MRRHDNKNPCISFAMIGCVIALVLMAGCSSPPAQSPAAVTVTLPATSATTIPATTIPVLQTEGSCRQGLTWCTDHCVDLAFDIGNCGTCGNACPSGQSCVDRTCCRKGLSSCNGTCSDLAFDDSNCGSCGIACPEGSVCYHAKCVNVSIECPAGQTLCFDEKCYDLTQDNMNCGSCGNVCPAFSGCISSVCVDMEGDFVDRPNIIINMPV